jgi:hypothetical protein
LKRLPICWSSRRTLRRTEAPPQPRGV